MASDPSRSSPMVALGMSLAVLLFMPTAHAEPFRFGFHAPAQLEGKAQTEGLRWVTLVFAPQSQATFTADLRPGTVVNHTHAWASATSPGRVDVPVALPAPDPRDVGAVGAEVAFGGSWASLHIEAERIELDVSLAVATVEVAHKGDSVFGHFPDRDYGSGAVQPGLAVPDDGTAFVAASDGPLPFRVSASGIHRMEWHNADLRCRPGTDCPDGGGETTYPAGPLGGDPALRLRSYLELRVSDGVLAGQGQAGFAVAGGLAVRSAFSGWGRFPQASLLEACPFVSCELDGSDTLLVRGNATLVGVAPQPGEQERLQGELAGDMFQVSADETRLDLRPSASASAVGGVVLTVVLWKAAALLFTRLRGNQVLEHPRRRGLRDLVHAEPGLSFREIRRRTGFGNGVLRHHLGKLLGAGELVAYEYRDTLRYFENHGRYEGSWKAVAVLRDDETRGLHLWIAEHPNVTQAAIVRHAHSAWGWRRTRTQDQVAKLRDASLVVARRSGVSTRYSAVSPSA